uniref:Sec1 family domain-containing protein 1 n=1 Tax=Ditylum brightwellii TaxID=49249 RepID=A0A7S1ZHK8_9STRA|mmetsp:Transcript_3173/g.4828  ORF Transcript_3173/g.4828 Transcript_3173/m.4828 type:complete len:673 (+) Transcript_3173:109-2127(+)
MTSSLKTSQLHAVSRMLNLNEDVITSSTTQASTGIGGNDLPPAGTPQNQWKILVYDAPCRSVISPLLSVSQLRRRGVTLHLLIQSDREPIPDVPAVYFVEPTRANLTQIASDVAKGLYASYHLNFVTRLDRSLMEEFARLVVQSGSISRIASLHDQYLDYVCLEKRLFTLNKRDSYVLYNGSGVTESVIEDAMNDIAYGLFSVVATMGCVPVIRCPKGGAPEMVARKLNKMISDHPTLLRGRGASGSAMQSHHRPLLVIMDRNSDLITPIQHTSTYQALIDDVLNHNANRIEFVVEVEENGRKKNVTKRFDLEADDDPFYSSHKFNPFPEAIESNGAELTEVTNRQSEIQAKTGASGNDGVDPMESAANELATAVDSLPALLDRKKKLEVHTSILQAVMNEVAARDVPQFYELESSLATGNYGKDLTKAKRDVLELVTDPAKGNVQDKVRLVIVYCLATTAPTADIDEVAGSMKNALETKGSAVTTGAQHGTLSIDDKKKLEHGMRAIDYLKKLRSMQMIPNMSDAMQDASGMTSGGGAGDPDMLSAFMARATNQATGLLAKATERVGTMLGKVHKHRVTRVVENLCEMKPNSEDEEYLYLDPKVKGDVDVSVLRNMTRAPVRDVIAFMIGGGCYAEYQNLQMISDERRVISYGSTELIDPCVFLNQLGKLA